MHTTHVLKKLCWQFTPVANCSTATTNSSKSILPMDHRNIKEISAEQSQVGGAREENTHVHVQWDWKTQTREQEKLFRFFFFWFICSISNSYWLNGWHFVVRLSATPWRIVQVVLSSPFVWLTESKPQRHTKDRLLGERSGRYQDAARRRLRQVLLDNMSYENINSKHRATFKGLHLSHLS